MFKKLMFLVVLVSISIPVFAQSGDTAWVRRYGYAVNAQWTFDYAAAVEADSSGNVYVIGTNNFHGYLTIKYYPNGDTGWVRWAGGGEDQAKALALDGSGNVYVTGLCYPPTTQCDIMTIKYYPNGDTAWVRRYDGSNDAYDSATAINVDGSGNVYVSGISFSDYDYSYNWVIIKYLPNGDTAWSRIYHKQVWFWGDGPNDLEVDYSGNAYVTGRSGGETDCDYITIKLYLNGDTAWVRRYNGPENGIDFAKAITVDTSGNVYVTGTCDYLVSSSLNSGDYVTIKYYPNGDTAWVRRYNGPDDSTDCATAIAVDGYSNVYVTGYSGFCYGSWSPTRYITIKYRPDGDTAWVRICENAGFDFAKAIDLDVAGNVYVTGQSYWFETDWDYATVKYYPNGDTAWVRRYNGPGNTSDKACAVALDSKGNVFVVGVSGDDHTTIKYRSDDTPYLSWSEEYGYENDGVSPDTGVNGTMFQLRIVYSDSNNISPKSGYPKVNIDLNGDGDFTDSNEGTFTMGAVEVDSNYMDGREYFYNTFLPTSLNCQYSFSAKNNFGVDAVGEPTTLKSGPVILDPSVALDLYIYSSDITFSKSNPSEGEAFTVFATVHNNSDSNLSNVSVSFYSGEELLDSVRTNIGGRSSSTVSIPLSFDTKGFYPIKVVVDKENQFNEWDELNNYAIRPVTVGDYVFPGGIVVNAQLNSPVYPYSWINVSGEAHYTPEYLGAVSGATVRITIQETADTFVTRTNDPGNFSFGFYGTSYAGDYTVKVEVTDYTLTGYTTLDLKVVSVPGVDLTIRTALSDHQLAQDQETTVKTKIFNFGTESAQNFWVKLYKDGSSYYSYRVTQLLAGDSLQIPDTLISFASRGLHTVSGIVDAGDSVAEYNEGNNISIDRVYVWCNGPDLTVTKISFSEPTAKGRVLDQPIEIAVDIVNMGGIGVSQTFGVEFSDNGVPFDTEYVSSLAPFASETVHVSTDFIYTDTIVHSFQVFVDPESLIAECDENNNTMVSVVSCTYDLYLYYKSRCPWEHPYAYPYLFSACKAFVGSPITIYGSVRNKGVLDINGQVQIEVTDNLEGLLGIITVDSVLNLERNTVIASLTHAFTSYGWHTVTLHADFDSQYYECGIEGNNIYSGSIFVDTLKPDLEVASEYIEFSPVCPTWDDSVWLQATIYNIGEVDINNVFVRFTIDDSIIGSEVVVDSIPIGENNYSTVLSSAPWIFPRELEILHVCRVIIDPNDHIPELSEDNNEATRGIPAAESGNVNRDCNISVSDVIYLINYLFKGGPPPYPFPAGDVNCDSQITIADVVYLINYLFKGGPAPEC